MDLRIALIKVKEFYLRYEKFISEIMNTLNVTRKDAIAILNLKEDPIKVIDMLYYSKHENTGGDSSGGKDE